MMLDAILAWDTGMFRLINEPWQSPTLDGLLSFVTHWENFRLPFVLAAVVLLLMAGLRGRRFVLLALLTVLVADAMSTYAVKYPVWRARPCITLEEVRLLVGCVNSPSFPSNHAVNASALATLVGLESRLLLMPAWMLAFLVAYSRIYVGVHYPLDVMCGAALGMSVALLLSWGMTTLLRVVNLWQDSPPQAGRPTHSRKVKAF
jgi:undecaprenyl-diphosphatase